MGIYDSIAKRTGGDVYVGVVGPVRSGKSTFIKRFMETAVIPNIEGGAEAARARDELPQGAGGVTVMTSEPKFVPERAVTVTSGNVTARVRLADCVGYLVEGAEGVTENGEERRVSTPWSDEPLPFTEAARLGTKKVIREHSTVAVLVTSDGTVTDIPRESYVPAERECVQELRAAGVPFVIVVNSREPEGAAAESLALSLETEYGAPTALLSCADLDDGDCGEIVSMLAGEFPAKELTFSLPDWFAAVPGDHPLAAALTEAVRNASSEVRRLSDASEVPSSAFPEGVTVSTENISLGDGRASLSIDVADPIYFKTLSELSGCEVSGRAELMRRMREFSGMSQTYNKYREAIEDAERSGYGVVTPTVSEMELEPPVIVKEGGAYGVRLRARAPSVHLIRADIETEISPVVGTEAESSELVKYLLSGFDGAEERIWETELFGKPLCDLVGEGLHSKLAGLPEDARAKLGETLSRIINDGADGLICILL